MAFAAASRLEQVEAGFGGVAADLNACRSRTDALWMRYVCNKVPPPLGRTRPSAHAFITREKASGKVPSVSGAVVSPETPPPA